MQKIPDVHETHFCGSEEIFLRTNFLKTPRFKKSEALQQKFGTFQESVFWLILKK